MLPGGHWPKREYWQSYMAGRRSLAEARNDIERLTKLIERTRGREIGRLRAVWRLTLAWSPVGVFSALVAVPALRPWLYAPVPAFTVATLMAAGVIWTIWRPTRGPHDIIAGTVIGVR